MDEQFNQIAKKFEFMKLVHPNSGLHHRENDEQGDAVVEFEEEAGLSKELRIQNTVLYHIDEGLTPEEGYRPCAFALEEVQLGNWGKSSIIVFDPGGGVISLDGGINSFPSNVRCDQDLYSSAISITFL